MISSRFIFGQDVASGPEILSQTKHYVAKISFNALKDKFLSKGFASIHTKEDIFRIKKLLVVLSTTLKLRLKWASEAFINLALNELVDEGFLVKEGNLYKSTEIKEDFKDSLKQVIRLQHNLFIHSLSLSKLVNDMKEIIKTLRTNIH